MYLQSLQFCEYVIKKCKALLINFVIKDLPLSIYTYLRKFYFKVFFILKRIYRRDVNSSFWKYIYYIYYNKHKLKDIFNYIFFRFRNISNFILNFRFSILMIYVYLCLFVFFHYIKLLIFNLYLFCIYFYNKI